MFFMFFPLAIWIGIFSQQCLLWIGQKRKVLSCALLVGSAVLVVQAHHTSVPMNPHYGDMVTKYRDNIVGKIVFFEGRRDGDFIFAIRERLGKRKAIIVRGSKILYSCAADPIWYYKSYVSNTLEVHEKLNSFGFSTLFVEQKNVAHVKVVDLLHDYLRDNETFAHIDTIDHRASQQGLDWINRTIDVYMPIAPGMRTVRFVDIPIPISSQQIRIDLDELTAELSDL